MPLHPCNPRRIVSHVTDSKTWQSFFNAHRGSDDGATVARKTGVSAATVSRWVNGTTQPMPSQVAAFARAYNANPLAALIAAEYLTVDDLDHGLEISPAQALSEIATPLLLGELQRRLGELRDLFATIENGSDQAGIADLVSELQRRHLDDASSVRRSQEDGNDYALAALDEPDWRRHQEEEQELP